MAEWKDGKLSVWTGTQRPFGVRGELAEAFRVPEDHVRVEMPDMGAGYGGKHSGEAARGSGASCQVGASSREAGVDT